MVGGGVRIILDAPTGSSKSSGRCSLGRFNSTLHLSHCSRPRGDCRTFETAKRAANTRILAKKCSKVFPEATENARDADSHLRVNEICCLPINCEIFVQMGITIWVTAMYYYSLYFSMLGAIYIRNNGNIAYCYSNMIYSQYDCR